MMTRHTPPTRGDALVMGHSIRTDFQGAAKCMGVVTQVLPLGTRGKLFIIVLSFRFCVLCFVFIFVVVVVVVFASHSLSIFFSPQDNSLYGELDSVDHLWLFARVRGVPESDIPRLVEDCLNLMELQPHKHKPSKKLSGGMKRKLCTALSLIGNPAVVVMDEPSSGLDPSSRRNLWKVINQTMQQRAVVLTTHLLDEAEALCGRIGIMTFGQLQCVGSAQHLRSKFGSGYQVEIPLTIFSMSFSYLRFTFILCIHSWQVCSLFPSSYA